MKNSLKKRKTLRQKLVTVFAVFMCLILVFACSLLLGADMYLDSKLNYISYDDGTEEWSGADIDAPDYDLDEGVPLLPDDFQDPEEDDVVLPPANNDDNSNTEVKPDAEKPKDNVINILLIGADTLTGAGRSDTMILLSVNTDDRRVVLTSFMRDSWVSIPGRNQNRLNAAHAAGGPALLMQTLYENFGISVDQYVKVDFSSFKKAVDVIGGIDITVNENNYDYFSKKYSGISLGTVKHLNGEEALLYARDRNYSQGDFIRTLHQRDLLTQFAKQMSSKSLSEIDALLNLVLGYVRTNIPKEELKDYIGESITYLGYDITTARVPCAGSFKNANKNGRAVLEIDIPMNIQYVNTKIYG